MFSKLGKFYALSWQQKKLLLHAFLLLGIKRLAIRSMSFKHLSKSMQHRSGELAHQSLNSEQLDAATAIGWAVVTAARYTPWNSNCLTQVLAAQYMLSKQHIAGVFFLGVKKDTSQLEAHAWLQCDEHVLTGKTDHETYAIVSTFSWP